MAMAIRYLGAVLLIMPLVAFAQTDSLRTQIRADLMADPRTATLSSTELDALVEALASEAESSGAADTYLDAKSAPTFTYEFPAPEVTNPYVILLTTPIVIAILALLAGILGIVLLTLYRRSVKRTVDPIPSSDLTQ